MNIGLFPGHHIYSPGCEGGGLREHPLCRMVVDRVKSECHRRFWTHSLNILDPYPDFNTRASESANTDSVSLKDRIDWCNTTPELDVVVEVHLNASADPSVKYPLVVVQPEREESYDLAHAIGDRFVKSLQTKEQVRVRTPEQLEVYIRIIDQVTAPTVVLEPMFLSHPDTQRVIEADIYYWVGRYAESILYGLMEYSNKAERPRLIQDEQYVDNDGCVWVG
jgi:N-acetylmuramoyl-L-alanine amidase